MILSTEKMERQRKQQAEKSKKNKQKPSDVSLGETRVKLKVKIKRNNYRGKKGQDEREGELAYDISAITELLEQADKSAKDIEICHKKYQKKHNVYLQTLKDMMSTFGNDSLFPYPWISIDKFLEQYKQTIDINKRNAIILNGLAQESIRVGKDKDKEKEKIKDAIHSAKENAQKLVDDGNRHAYILKKFL